MINSYKFNELFMDLYVLVRFFFLPLRIIDFVMSTNHVLTKRYGGYLFIFYFYILRIKCIFLHFSAL